MPAPTDTPSTDGAPDPEEVTDEIDVKIHDFLVEEWGVDDVEAWEDTTFMRRSLAATGLRVVPEDRPAQCPRCGSKHWDMVRWQCDDEDAADPFHDGPAGVPALDDDTRREVEALIVMLTQNSFHLTQTEMNRIAELLASAYLGGTDGR